MLPHLSLKYEGYSETLARLATNLNDLENLSDHIHYYSTSQDSLAPMYKQKEEETKAKALLQKITMGQYIFWSNFWNLYHYLNQWL